MHTRKLGNQQNKQDAQVQAQRLPPIVGAMGGQQEGGDRHSQEELAIGGVLDAVIQLLPEGLCVIAALVHWDGRTLVPVQQVVAGEAVA